MEVATMYMVQMLQSWIDPPEWTTLATFTDRDQAERELERLTISGCEVRLVNDADDVKGDENT